MQSRIVLSILLALSVFSAVGIVAACASIGKGVSISDRGSLVKASDLWKNGDIEDAQIAALELPLSPERSRLLFDCAFAKGDYDRAIQIFSTMGPGGGKRDELEERVVDAYVHMDRFEEAAAFARGQGMAKWLIRVLDAQAANPLRVELDKTISLPFVSVPMMGLDFSDSLPGVEAEIGGEHVVAHFDSGGPFLVMSIDRAKSMGIELIAGPIGFAGLAWGSSCYGIAKSFRIGDALMENVPVYAASQIKGDVDRVYFGTNILEHFLATLDFPSRRLILSPRHKDECKKEQVDMLAPDRKEVPFYLWGDHFMFARGAFGEEGKLNFFIDSGLFFVVNDEGGRQRRGSFLVEPERAKRLGAMPSDLKKGYFFCTFSALVGSLEQQSPVVAISSGMKTIATNFGGVRIDALLSNGFLSDYAWTIDFDRRQYVLSR